MAATKPEKAPILAEKTPSVKYNRRYDQVSWRSADTDFEPEPSVGNGTVDVKKGSIFCTKRKRKLIALIVVVAIFLIIMGSLIYLYYSKPNTVDATISIDTDSGQVQGVIHTIRKKKESIDVSVFKGVPYAVPPVGKHRWSAPQKLDNWKGVLKAYKFASKCAQGNDEGSEDCLYLNIYTPKLEDDADLPVVVWIHGGYLVSGSSSSPNDSPNLEFALETNAVVVTINYRLNAFGFLTLEELWQEGKSYANFGLMDQILALQWVQSNIKKFGGDPNSVTISGHNGGASSALALLASPSTNGLFHRVISMSGFPKIDIPYKTAAKQNRQFINHTRCYDVTGSAEIRKCLYNLTRNEVLDGFSSSSDIYSGFIRKDLLDFPMKGNEHGGLIVIDPIIVTKPLKDINKNKVQNKISILIGSTAQEIGISPLMTFEGDSEASYLHQTLSQRLDTFKPNMTNTVLGKLYNNKTFGKNISKTYISEYIYESIVSDVRVNCPTNSLFDTLSKNKNYRVFRYVIKHRPTKPITIYWHPARFAFHMWDKIALFNFGSVQEKYTPDKNDLKFRLNLLKTFRHFILYGHMEVGDWSTGMTSVFSQSGDVKVLPSKYNEKQCLFWNDPSNGFVPYAWSI